VWIIIPLIYVMAYRFCRSFRQSFHETAAFVIGYLGSAGVILALDVGGYDGLRATPDSPGAALAILGGFVGMIVSHVRWKRRGGDPPRQPGAWERAIRASISGTPKAKRPAARPASRPVAAQPAPTQKVAASPSPASPQPPHEAPARQASANGERRSPSADKYAKATGRALAAMFNSGKKPKPGARR
jgi:pyruvate/2-oxoglutarate dehydrogenase complex dihydrolipoamide acyltransferase (E2) component